MVLTSVVVCDSGMCVSTYTYYYIYIHVNISTYEATPTNAYSNQQTYTCYIRMINIQQHLYITVPVMYTD